MKNIKAKIKKIEEVKKQINGLEILKGPNANHLHPAICLKNGSDFIYGIVIDNDLFQQLLSSQTRILEDSIREDEKFIEAVELMISSGANKTEVSQTIPTQSMAHQIPQQEPTVPY